jgi:hypothetical protein
MSSVWRYVPLMCPLDDDDDDDEPDLFSAKSERDKALESVSAHAGEWMDIARDAFDALPSGTTGIFEDFKLQLIHAGLAAPHHHNAWGALARDCATKGILTFTGEFRNMRGRKSHARMSPVYRLR